MTDLETKRKHIETAMKILGLGALCLILGPVYLTLLHGLGALIALGIAAAGDDPNFKPCVNRLFFDFI